MNFDYRLQKQIIIAVVYLLILGLIIFSIYYIWFNQGPTCFDKIKNQKEEDIDCGGPCPSCEIKTLQDIKIIWAKSFLIKDGIYDLAAQIKNPNPNYGSSRLVYEFRAYDALNNFIFSKSGEVYILPNQTKYIIEPFIKSQQNVVKIELAVLSQEWIKLQEGFENNLFFIKNKEIGSFGDDSFVQISGAVENNSSFDFDRVNVGVVLFNASDEPIGVNRTEIRTHISGEARYFTVKWFSKINEDIASVDAEAETNIFSNDNFMKRYGVSEKFKGLQ